MFRWHANFYILNPILDSITALPYNMSHLRAFRSPSISGGVDNVNLMYPYIRHTAAQPRGEKVVE
jgi:hypothetical protein